VIEIGVFSDCDNVRLVVIQLNKARTLWFNVFWKKFGNNGEKTMRRVVEDVVRLSERYGS